MVGITPQLGHGPYSLISPAELNKLPTSLFPPPVAASHNVKSCSCADSKNAALDYPGFMNKPRNDLKTASCNAWEANRSSGLIARNEGQNIAISPKSAVDKVFLKRILYVSKWPIKLLCTSSKPEPAETGSRLCFMPSGLCYGLMISPLHVLFAN